MTRALDAAAEPLRSAVGVLWRLTTPLRWASNSYLGVTGLGQHWRMFANPPLADEYLRVRYYVSGPDGTPADPRLWIATELVMPTGPEFRPRLLRAYFDSYRDKAFAIALARFADKRPVSLVAPGTRPDQLPDDLAPVGRYFARRFAERSLAEGERIVRVETWYGSAPNPAPGQAPDAVAAAERQRVLEAYSQGPIQNRLNVPPFPPYHGGEREADIEWILEYYEEP